MKYYTEKEIRFLIPTKLKAHFYKFMFGQTCGFAPDGSNALYKHDVDRFLIRHNITPLEGTKF